MIRRVLVVLAVAVLALLGATSPAFAAGRVDDGAGVLDSGKLTSAASSLSADVVFVSFADSNNNLQGALRKAGSAAGFSGDAAEANTVVLAVGVADKQVGVYYGPGLDLTDSTVKAAMSGPFAKGQWTQGMLAGLDEVKAELGGATRGTSSTSGGGGASFGLTLGIIGVVALALLGWVGYRRVGRRKQAAAAAAAAAEQASANRLTAVQLRERLDNILILVHSLPDGVDQSRLSAELNDVDVALRAIEVREGDAPDPHAEADQMARMTAGLDRTARHLDLLRQGAGWEQLWNDEVAQVRAEAQRLVADAATLRAESVDNAVDVTDHDAELAGFLSAVRDGRVSVSDGLNAVLAVEEAVSRQSQDVAGRLATERASKRRAAEAGQRAQEQERERQSRGGGGWGTGYGLGYGIGYGSGWGRGGGWGGGGSWGGSGGGSSSGFGGGGSSGGFGGGGSSGGFGGGGGGGGGGSSSGF
ncbi:MAG: TPM domain-containing protein [Mycobacteriaceae bacterium]